MADAEIANGEIDALLPDEGVEQITPQVIADAVKLGTAFTKVATDALDTRVDGEASTRVASIRQVSEDITTEAQNRERGDTALGERIDTEKGRLDNLTAADIAYGDGSVADTLNAEPTLHDDAVSTETFNTTTGTSTQEKLDLKLNTADLPEERTDGAVRALAEAQITEENLPGGKIADAIETAVNNIVIPTPRTNAEIDGRADARIAASPVIAANTAKVGTTATERQRIATIPTLTSGLSGAQDDIRSLSQNERTPEVIAADTDARIVEQIKPGGTIATAIGAGGGGGLDNDAVDARIDAKQIPAVFQTVADTVPQQHPMTKFIVTPANSPLQTTPFTFSSDFAGVADGSVVKLGGVFHFGLNPSRGSLPLCSLIITQGTKHLRTFTNLNAQTGNDIQYLAQRGAGDIKFQPVVATTNELDQDVYPFLDVQDVAFTGVYHDILIEILNANIALATAETRGMLASVVGQVQSLSGLIQNTNDDVAALRATLDALVSKVDNPALNFLSQSTVSPATVGLTTERLPLGDEWDAEIVDHATIEPAFSVGAQEMRDISPLSLVGLSQNWFDANLSSWQLDTGGSTGSTGAGPGTNSPGPYIHWEASGSGRQNATPITITGGSNADTDVKAWLDHNGARNIEFLYNYVSRPSTVTGDAFFVAEQLDKDGAVIAARQYSDWEYQASPAQGATIDLEVGTNFVSELPGGWRRVGMDLLPECRSVKLYNIPENPVGSGDFVNDLAFYDIRISESGLDTPSDNAAAGASGQAGATGQADGLVQGLIVELESGDLNYDTDAIARVRDGAVYGIRQVAEIPAGTRTVDNFTGASPAIPFDIPLGINNQHAQATRSFAPPQIIPAGTVVRGHLNVSITAGNASDFTLDYVWGSNVEQTEVFTQNGETLTVHMEELNGEVVIRTTEVGANSLPLDGGHLTGYFSFPVATPKIDATTEEVRLQGHSGVSVLGFTDSVTNPTLVIYYGNGAQFDTGLTNRDFLDHYILTTSGNPGAFRVEVATVDAFNVSGLQANYAAGVRYLGLFRDKPHHTQLFGLQGGLTFIKRDGVEANLEDELAKGGGGGIKRLKVILGAEPDVLPDGTVYAGAITVGNKNQLTINSRSQKWEGYGVRVITPSSTTALVSFNSFGVQNEFENAINISLKDLETESVRGSVIGDTVTLRVKEITGEVSSDCQIEVIIAYTEVDILGE
ncbi:MAG: immune inhibitor A [Gammaproteobacteria bacterium]|nr:immune inhibitor A [Gammaproteobacteria bacterium]